MWLYVFCWGQSKLDYSIYWQQDKCGNQGCFYRLGIDLDMCCVWGYYLICFISYRFLVFESGYIVQKSVYKEIKNIGR